MSVPRSSLFRRRTDLGTVGRAAGNRLKRQMGLPVDTSTVARW